MEYDLRPGGRYRAFATDATKAARAQMGGAPTPDVILDGEVIETDPPRRLVQTWRMLMDPQSTAQGFTRLTYEIEEMRPGICKLTLTHELEGAPRLATFVDESGMGRVNRPIPGARWPDPCTTIPSVREPHPPVAAVPSEVHASRTTGKGRGIRCRFSSRCA